MVAHSRATLRPGRLRALNQPRPIDVECEAGRPTVIKHNGKRLPVAEITDVWLIEDEWWQNPLARRYLRLLLADGRLLTVFEDLLGGAWYVQRYPDPVCAELR
jgi:hypothetical protein